MQIRKYKPSRLGLGTESSQNFQPIDFSPEVTNRFYNLLGDLEKRPGLLQLGNDVTAQAGGSDVIALFEHVDRNGNETILAQTSGGLAKYDPTSQGWDIVRTSGAFPPVQTNRFRHAVQMGNRLIITGGENTTNFPYYYEFEDGEITASDKLYPVVSQGIASNATTQDELFDNNVEDWINETNVAVNDLVEFTRTSAGATETEYLRVYGLITSVGTTSLDMTVTGTAGTGIGNGPEFTTLTELPYRIFDLVDNNIIEQSNNIFRDNVAVATTGTDATNVYVDGVIWNDTDLRVGDYIFNTTRSAVTQVTAVTSILGFTFLSVASVAGQTNGDSLVFVKSAMPRASFAHVHYGRLHLIDSDDPTKIRVSGPDDPQDFTTFAKTLQSSSLDYGSDDPKGDVLLTIGTFQRYLVVGGRQSVYVTEGTNPIQDTTADVVDLDPVGLFPQGVVSQRGLQSIGSEMLYIGRDGLRSFIPAYDARNTATTNKSESIKTELINQISTNLPESYEEIQLAHYPRRNWVMMKVGENIYNYNYTPTYELGNLQTFGTITRFTGLLSATKAFLVRRDGTLLVGGDRKVYEFDLANQFTDASQRIFTAYTSPWHTLQEGQTDLSLQIKHGKYIKPYFETNSEIPYNISVVGDYDRNSTDAIVVTAQGAAIVGQAIVGQSVISDTAVTDPKFPLRWKGEQFQVRSTTDTSGGGDIIHEYTIYGNVFGRR